MEEKNSIPSTVKGAEKDKKLTKAVTGTVQIKKKGKATQLLRSFFVEDIKSVMSFVGMQILLPAMKKTFVDMINSAANSLVNGFGNYVTGKKTISSNMNISYKPYYESRSQPTVYNPQYVPPRPVYDYDEVILNSEQEACHVIDMMKEILERYPTVSVADLYQLVGWAPNQVDFDWGWTDLRDTQIIRTYDGRYTIRLPKIRPLDR